MAPSGYLPGYRRFVTHPVQLVLILTDNKILFIIKDLQECRTGNQYSCHNHAKCTDTIGSYICECYPGFDGDDSTCEGK